MMTPRNKNEKGSVNVLFLTTIGLAVLTVGFAALAVWAYVNYNDQKTNVDGKVTSAVAVAKKAQADSDAASFEAADKLPNRTFVGPDDYGRLTFSYPKTWSLYVDKDISSGGTTYAAYLNPGSVPSVSSQATQQYALRVTIESMDYDKVVATYEALVKTGALKSSAVTVNGNNGTRIDGNFTKDIRGSAVIFKIRDKTVTLRTDADTFKPDFEALIKTIKFNS
jgi:hypothetical protein